MSNLACAGQPRSKRHSPPAAVPLADVFRSSRPARGRRMPLNDERAAAPNDTNATDPLFDGDGEIARLMRVKDWSATALGPSRQWPRSLRTIVRTMLTTRFSIWMGWGPQLNMFYNDAYR